ncbi:Aldo/keto reductase [Metarhizium rileyi]|uniref:Aldo/keto reductase n=1 Tax=Metarhizium rileyi (strain RCEF 4871) TaxID=1649241 RepID=A0A167AM62_METRR|nr:Aldo/keto reductase [Metarhizium rileyi RCEF 4871]
MFEMPEKRANSLNKIPLLGLGTYQGDGTDYAIGTARNATLVALKKGYRHIDTAYAYGNGIIEREIGEAIADSHIARSEIFVVTNLHNTFHDPQDVKTGLDMSLRNLNLDYAQGIQAIAHCPLGGSLAPAVARRRGGGPLADETIKAIAEVHNKTPAQIILAWLTRQGIAVVPKSSQPSRIESNYDINFSLTAEEQWKMATLVGLHGENGVRNLSNEDHIGFDVFDEEIDQPA